MPLLAVTYLMYVYMLIFMECSYGLHKDVEGSLGMAVGQVGLLSLLYCTLLPARVDGFTRLSYFLQGCSVVVVLRIPLRGRVVLWSRIFHFFLLSCPIRFQSFLEITMEPIFRCFTCQVY